MRPKIKKVEINKLELVKKPKRVAKPEEKYKATGKVPTSYIERVAKARQAATGEPVTLPGRRVS